jgi:A/G-specific adenine glycosylase
MSLSADLLAWYKEEGRDLPWRGTHDPYRILVSEMMLQQTQVARVLEYYDKWFTIFPDWEALAESDNKTLLDAWAGLGYNRRALALREIARQVLERGVPRSREEWLKLKGIGPYTSAVLSIFTRTELAPPVDTNIRRTVGRLKLGIPFAQLSDDKEIEPEVEKLLQDAGDDYHHIPQALFDLANSYCGKKSDCAACPFKESCATAEQFLSGTVEVPRRTIKKANEKVREGKRYPDRIYRGRILAFVRKNPGADIFEAGGAADDSFTEADAAWIQAMADRMERDGLIKQTDGKLFV